MTTHSGYDQITNERLDTLYRLYIEADNMAAERDYADEHYNECSQAAHANYCRAVAEANEARRKPQLSFVARGKAQPVSPEWAMYEAYLHMDYANTISDFLAGTR